MRRDDRAPGAHQQERQVASDHRGALESFAAGAAHAINNPLAYVISNLAFVSAELDELLASPSSRPPPERERLVELEGVLREAAEGAEQIRVIVHDLGTLSQATGEHLELVDVSLQLELVAAQVKGQLASRARLVRDLGVVAPMLANPVRLGQALHHLLLHAARSVPEGHPEENEVRLVARMEGTETVLVEVHDTGPGLSPAARARLFEPFFVAREGEADSGLGLYVARNLAAAMGGTLEVESGAERGSVLRLRLPASGSAR